MSKRISFLTIVVIGNRLSCSWRGDLRHAGSLGPCYSNDTDLGANTFFTGSNYFQVKEIAVFEMDIHSRNHGCVTFIQSLSKIQRETFPNPGNGFNLDPLL
jgi:hypothetical protein